MPFQPKNVHGRAYMGFRYDNLIYLHYIVRHNKLIITTYFHILEYNLV